MYVALRQHWTLWAWLQAERTSEREGACEARRRREGGECVRVCVLWERERARRTELETRGWERYSHKLGGSLSCQPNSCGCGRKKEWEQGRQREWVQREEDFCCPSLPVWVAGGRAWMVRSPPPWDAASVLCRSLRSSINYSMKSARYCDQPQRVLSEYFLARFCSGSMSEFLVFSYFYWLCVSGVSGWSGIESGVGVERSCCWLQLLQLSSLNSGQRGQWEVARLKGVGGVGGDEEVTALSMCLLVCAPITAHLLIVNWMLTLSFQALTPVWLSLKFIFNTRVLVLQFFLCPHLKKKSRRLLVTINTGRMFSGEQERNRVLSFCLFQVFVKTMLGNKSGSMWEQWINQLTPCLAKSVSTLIQKTKKFNISF